MATPPAAAPDGALPSAANQQAALAGTPAGTGAHAPPQVPLSTKFPVSDMMGAVDAIQAHHQQQVEEHRLAAEAAAAAATGPGPGSSSAGGAPSSSNGSSGETAGGNEAGGSSEGKPPLGYPGTFFLEKPLSPEEAHTIPRMWQPPGGSYPGYPYGGGPGYPPPPLTGPPPGSQQSQYPGSGAPAYPPASPYPQVHHAPAPASTGSSYGASAPPYPGAAPYPAALQQQPQRVPSVPPSMPPAGTSGGRKKAFIVGINYFGTSAQLRGCINDAKCMEYLLKSKFGFKQENILMMTDDCPDPLRRPTRANMYQGFRWLLMDMKPGDSLVFHYSGHGSQQRDYSGEETDGMNETLCPMDFKQAGEIVDDELNRMLINPLPTGVKLHAIIDACHSGSVMDLPFQAHVRGGYAQWESSYHYTRSHKGTAGGFAVQFGAAKDSQTAADTQALAGNTSTGAATFCFIQAIERRGTKLSYGELLIAMHNTLQERMGPAAMGPSSSGGLLGMLLGGSMMSGGGSYRGQEPVLSGNYAFDMSFPFSL
ncbi:hypothetical protein ABPG77_006290 [Micractinium sp. CCAP 211/92]